MIPIRFLLLGGLFLISSWTGAGEARYLEAARKTADWLRHIAVDTEQGRTWPPDPNNPEQLADHLYHGGSGVVLFFVELSRVTGEKAYLEDAVAGGDFLLANLPETLAYPVQASLYIGVGGIGFVLDELYLATKKKRFREGAVRCLSLVRERLEKPGIEGHGEVTDIIAGHAGMGLYLLDAAQRLDRPEALKSAARLGELLLKKAEQKTVGWSWSMSPDYPREMPNFSHGTAGIAFFLARLHHATGNKDFLEAAVKGGQYLQHLAQEDGLVYHHTPDGTDLFYLGWCHGPVGTSFLYEQLWIETRGNFWRDAMLRGMTTVRDLALHEKRTPGFWNNVGLCCGSAGVSDRALDIYRQTGDASFLAYARQIADDILARATVEENRLKWIQAEHRVKPELLIARTGYMQGASGIGLFLIHLHRLLNGHPDGVRLPDTPTRKK